MSIILKKKFWNLALPAFLVLSGVASAQSLENAVHENQATGTISGRIIIKGAGPLSGGLVHFFSAAAGPPPSVDNFERPPDFTILIGEDGSFKAELPEGAYYFKAVKRLSGAKYGPPQAGDLVHRNVDGQGQPIAYRVEAGKTIETGAALDAVLLKPKEASEQARKTAIEGVVTGVDGKPLVNAVVIAFTDPLMKGKPVFVSRKTDIRGGYILVVEAGIYYLKVREGFGEGPPRAGQMVGYFGDENGPLPVVVKKGRVKKNINLTATKFAGRGPGPGSR